MRTRGRTDSEKRRRRRQSIALTSLSDPRVSGQRLLVFDSSPNHVCLLPRWPIRPRQHPSILPDPLAHSRAQQSIPALVFFRLPIRSIIDERIYHIILKIYSFVDRDVVYRWISMDQLRERDRDPNVILFGMLYAD